MAGEQAKPLVGIQIGAISFADEGVDAVLDTVQERAGVNAVMFAVFTMTRGTGGRQIPNHPFPDHGKQEYDRFFGGNFAKTHPQFYPNTIIRDFDAPDEATKGVDWMEALLPACQKRGIALYAWVVEDIALWLPNTPKLLQWDVFGRPHPQVCYANPDYRNWMLGLMEDYCRSYPAIAGIMWGTERSGPLEATLLGGVPYCFCPHCVRRGRDEGIDVHRAREGLRALYEFAQSARKGERPNDGFLVTFLRLLMRYPEILQWERLWFVQQQELHQLIYGTVKAIDRRKTVGYHIWHRNSFSVFYRAEWDFSEIRHYADWLKPVLYNNCAGARFHDYLAQCHRTWLADASPQETYRLFYRFLGIDEGDYDDLPTRGWSAEYVRRETERTVRAVNGEIPVYPGIDIDIPSGRCPTTRERVREAVLAAFAGGASGVILSRKYSEMRLDNLSGAGDALRELGYL
jgi:hypothetical protein